MFVVLQFSAWWFGLGLDMHFQRDDLTLHCFVLLTYSWLPTVAVTISTIARHCYTVVTAGVEIIITYYYVARTRVNPAHDP